MKPLRPLPLLLGCTLAQAHPGHGLAGAGHWHASDVLGFVVVLAVAAGLALWHDRRK